MTEIDKKPLAIVTGVGPGTGTALVRRFASGGRLAMLARPGRRPPDGPFHGYRFHKRQGM
ncbi:hypothetical protein D3C85_1187780 [compost metagenome]